MEAWREEHSILDSQLSAVFSQIPAAADWGIVFEFELPLEGGRRPDVVILAGSAIVVLEFKSQPIAYQAWIDQVDAYARDLSEYHAASHGVPVHAILVLGGATVDDQRSRTLILGPSQLANHLIERSRPGSIELKGWLEAPYTPLPTLVAAARRIFKHEPLPNIRRALSEGIPQTVELLVALANQAEARSKRMLILLTGVPGSGKTLAGIRLVYERSDTTGKALFLSGNGPLVKVLQNALKSVVFVRDLHAFVRTYGIGSRVPRENILVFDEAQRAWDEKYMHTKRGVQKSEPELLLKIGERVPGWTTLVGLIGEGQSIHSGEEGGLTQWRSALNAKSRTEPWELHCPPGLVTEFSGIDAVPHAELDLTASLRTRKAYHLHDWVSLLLNGCLELAAQQSGKVDRRGYPIYLTRNLEEAKRYARDRYAGEEEARFGLLTSSRARILPQFGIDNSFMATSHMNVGRWFNAAASDTDSCCALLQPVTEFGCQGLELDLPIVCWGEDYRWEGQGWHLSPGRSRYKQDNPEQLLRNAYRVLLTRGRDGMVIFVPPVAQLEETASALLRAGIDPLIPVPIRVTPAYRVAENGRPRYPSDAD